MVIHKSVEHWSHTNNDDYTVATWGLNNMKMLNPTTTACNTFGGVVFQNEYCNFIWWIARLKCIPQQGESILTNCINGVKI